MAQPEHPIDTPVPSLTLRERLWLFPILARLPFAIITGVFRENKGRSWSHAAHIAATRYLFRFRWDIRTLRSYVGVTTSQVYQNWARGEKQEVLTDILPEGAKLHWIGPRRDRTQDRVFLFFHGGGFSLPARPDYFRFLYALKKDVSASFGDIGVVALEYSLAPDYPLPTQLKQANSVLSHLLKNGISPGNIVIGGDSVGGNLVLQLASHLLHPLPSIPPPPALSQPLAGAMFISPWCAYDQNRPSYVRNSDKDVIPAVTYAQFSQFLVAELTSELEPYCHPFVAPASWWKGLDGVFARALITAGENEGPLDHIVEIGTTISQHVKDTVTMVETGAVHEEMIFRFATGKDGVGKVYEDMVVFLSRSFQD